MEPAEHKVLLNDYVGITNKKSTFALYVRNKKEKEVEQFFYATY